ncbi:uncharacterized protein LOC133816496 [Humulus lupulus]|uniref:uncharacterized protein LOC133816496 n=1 Tax=Humulus lupulus TaxID=3486 RepID=UPI002B40847C|nr:uncharacterized protein LOC133816496 [Humulus lupulus]
MSKATTTPNIGMPSIQPAAPTAPSKDLAMNVARLREQLRLRDDELAHARKVPQLPKVPVAQPQPPTPPPAPLPMTYGFEPVYEHFRKQAPPTFEGEVDPVVAKDWLRSIEAIFDHMELNDRQRISCAAHLLKFDARIWWDVIKHTQDLNTMTWAEFVQAFSKKYYNAAVLATNVDEFVTLIQGNLSITNYAQKFDRLAKFAPEVVPPEALRVQRFMRGLKTMIGRDATMTNTEVVSYAKILDRALEAEYLEDRIWKDNAARRKVHRNKGSNEGNKRKANEGRIVALIRDQDPRP